jgi:hypothetical protein
LDPDGFEPDPPRGVPFADDPPRADVDPPEPPEVAERRFRSSSAREIMPENIPPDFGGLFAISCRRRSRASGPMCPARRRAACWPICQRFEVVQ